MALLLIAVLVVGVILATGGDDKKSADTKATSTTSAAGGGEIFLQAASDNGPDPFAPSTAAATPSSTIPLSTPVTLGPPTANGSAPTAPVFSTPSTASSNSTGALTVTARSGGTPGLYGGTRDQSSCDKQKMIDFLAANPAKAQAWADVQGIRVADVGSYVNGLTPVLLRSDARVTNHGFKNGRANAHQDVLQAGTAVLVDQYGLPRARCACGNPLLPPKAVTTTPSYKGKPWPGFNPGNVTVINNSTTVINVITIIDVNTGDPFGRPTGPQGGPDLPLPTTPSTTTTSTTAVSSTTTTKPAASGSTTTPATSGTTAPTTTTTAAPAGDFNLVDVQQSVGELVANWTVNARAGTAKLSIPAGDANYSWTVPDRIDPSGTSINWGGSTTPAGANLNINIAPRGDGIVFNTSDLTVDVTGAEGRKSAVITVPTSVQEVKLAYGMGFSVTATYTYRR